MPKEFIPILFCSNTFFLKVNENLIYLLGIIPDLIDRNFFYDMLVTRTDENYQVSLMMDFHESTMFDCPITWSYLVDIKDAKVLLPQYTNIPNFWFGKHEKTVLTFDGKPSNIKSISDTVKKWYSEEFPERLK